MLIYIFYKNRMLANNVHSLHKNKIINLTNTVQNAIVVEANHKIKY